jgi:hypothetical protein
MKQESYDFSHESVQKSKFYFKGIYSRFHMILSYTIIASIVPVIGTVVLIVMSWDSFKKEPNI